MLKENGPRGSTAFFEALKRAKAEASDKVTAPGDAQESGVEAAETTQDLYRRPGTFRAGVRETVWVAAREESTGQVRDPLTGRFMSSDRPWDMGHKPGFELRKHAEDARRRDLTRADFLDEHNNPAHYRPELPSSNRSHKGESQSHEFGV